jgi:hypothetical protein
MTLKKYHIYKTQLPHISYLQNITFSYVATSILLILLKEITYCVCLGVFPIRDDIWATIV